MFLFIKVVIKISVSRLNQVEEREHEHPHQVYKVPEQTYFLYHFVVTAALVDTHYRVEVYQEVEAHPAEYVEAVKSCDEEEECGKIARAVLRCCTRLAPSTFAGRCARG